jgi:hypothetical protein
LLNFFFSISRSADSILVQKFAELLGHMTALRGPAWSAS